MNLNVGEFCQYEFGIEHIYELHNFAIVALFNLFIINMA